MQKMQAQILTWGDRGLPTQPWQSVEQTECCGIKSVDMGGFLEYKQSSIAAGEAPLHHSAYIEGFLEYKQGHSMCPV